MRGKGTSRDMGARWASAHAERVCSSPNSQIVDRKSSTANPPAFTLIELLVVISILVLLMAILLPTLQQVRKRAKAAGCQAKLRQWGVVFCMYMNEHNEQFPCEDRTGAPPRASERWWSCARPYYGNLDDLFMCPIATRYVLNKNDPKWEENMAVGWGVGSKFTAWRIDPGPWNLERKMALYGGYGWNDFVPTTYCARSSALGMQPAPARSQMPFLLDCVAANGYGSWLDAPPAYDGDLSPPWGEMKAFCIDRHDQAIHSLFMDWSVRKVGLKELWALKWCGRYNTRGPWTRAGGVQPEDWPPWMRTFKDY
jgi:prepilin-type N-terminal cleavage/methylation domain-containing protein